MTMIATIIIVIIIVMIVIIIIIIIMRMMSAMIILIIIIILMNTIRIKWFCISRTYSATAAVVGIVTVTLRYIPN